MTDGTFHSVLRRKAGARRQRQRTAPPTPDKAMVQALAKAALDRMNLPLRVDENAAALLSLAELPEHLPDRALISLLAGPGDALGILSLDPALVAGFIEIQMAGRLGDAPVEPRRPTRTDAAMCAPFIDHFLRQLQVELGCGPSDGAPDGWAAGYSHSSMLDDPRTLGLLLEDQPYRCFRLSVELGIGTIRRGNLFLALPGAEAAGESLAATEVDAAAEHWDALLSAGVLAAPAVLGTILHRLVLPLGRAVALAPGMELGLPRGALDAVELTDGCGRRLARARLGQVDGRRALCLLAPGLPAAAGGEVDAGAAADAVAPVFPGLAPPQPTETGQGDFNPAPLAVGF